jgi:hypothetical protein
MRLDDLIGLKELLNIETRALGRLLRLAARHQVKNTGCEDWPVLCEECQERRWKCDLELLFDSAQIPGGDGDRRL